MSVVVDANLVAAIALPLPYSEVISAQDDCLERGREEIFAPVLWEYEVTTVLRRAVVVKLLSTEEAAEALGRLHSLAVRSVNPTLGLHRAALEWSVCLGQAWAYDAQYIALAEKLGVELWTADQRLANGARRLGVAWVRWVGEEL